MDRTKNHQKLLKESLLYLTGQGFLVWSNSTGAIKSASGRFQRYGLIGSSDILGLTPNGQFFAAEIKTGKAIQNKHQKAFQKAVEKRNGIYIVVRSLNDLKEFIGE